MCCIAKPGPDSLYRDLIVRLCFLSVSYSCVLIKLLMLCSFTVGMRVQMHISCVRIIGLSRGDRSLAALSLTQLV